MLLKQARLRSLLKILLTSLTNLDPERSKIQLKLGAASSIVLAE